MSIWGRIKVAKAIRKMKKRRKRIFVIPVFPTYLIIGITSPLVKGGSWQRKDIL